MRKRIFPKIRSQTRVSTIFTLIQYSSLLLSQDIKTKKETKGKKIGKEEFTLSLFADNIILCCKDHKDSSRKQFG
jgi:hypothetical protein